LFVVSLVTMSVGRVQTVAEVVKLQPACGPLAFLCSTPTVSVGVKNVCAVVNAGSNCDRRIMKNVSSRTGTRHTDEHSGEVRE